MGHEAREYYQTLHGIRCVLRSKFLNFLKCTLVKDASVKAFKRSYPSFDSEDQL